MSGFLLDRNLHNDSFSEAVAFPYRPRSVEDLSRSKKYSAIRRMPIVSIICIILSTCFATSNAFVPSSKTMRISRTETTLERSTLKASSTQLGIAKSGGKMIETEQEFTDNVLSKDLSRPVLVFFTAPWCGPCRLTVPVVKDVIKQFSGELDVVEVCTDELAEVAEDSGVVSIPTIQFYFDGAALETHSIVGCVAKSVLSNAVQKVIEDVAQIRKTKR
mmetsp:Transcript_7042/g.14535  ORF Transcript_7042/g.14535 Transcript_7042/m.14535 type:complete len:218 (+) Transcript_7042:211-864(+)|eukprot:CAMPEP_0197273860 /NCGR_PEP_ID=MMETSP1432-20130617/11868_1 /TAXON_ID=44447 /ORGANISM="Pseudo-nitzschia delicatissima, Strain UNC1205" /LENGTH=217 /DNA_ID=CAMNT_0042739589 /DNA_START=158 /DNA_END=811 /DNA_ORIENTATION=+